MKPDVDMRDAFIGELYHRALNDRDIIFLSAEFGAPSLDAFRRDLPGQFVNVGISEQNLISVAAGLALARKKVYAYSIASFITLRCYEQIKIDLCAMNLPVTLLGVGPCYAYSVDGPTHHATEDIAIMRALANMSIYSPTDAGMARTMVDVTLKSRSPSYVRLDRGRYETLFPESEGLANGFRVIKEGGDTCIVATGSMVHSALKVERSLAARDVKVGVIDLYRIKPLNVDNLNDEVGKYRRLVTIEEHTLNGGLGSVMLEFISDLGLVIPLRRFGITDNQLYAYGLRDRLHKERAIDVDSIVQSIQDWVS